MRLQFLVLGRGVRVSGNTRRGQSNTRCSDPNIGNRHARRVDGLAWWMLFPTRDRVATTTIPTRSRSRRFRLGTSSSTSSRSRRRRSCALPCPQRRRSSLALPRRRTCGKAKWTTAGAYEHTKVDVPANCFASTTFANVVRANGAVEVWPRVYEAAMLKVNNGVPCGNMPEAMGLLTGHPAVDVPTTDADLR